MNKNCYISMLLLLSIYCISCQNASEDKITLSYDSSEKTKSPLYITMLNRSKHRVKMYLGQGDNNSETEIYVDPNHQRCFYDFTQSNKVYYEYILNIKINGDEYELFIQRFVEIKSNGKDFKFTIPELEFSETELKSSSIVIKNKTKNGIDLRSPNNILLTVDDKEMIESGQTAMYEIGDFMNTYKVLYFYTWEKNYGLLGYRFAPGKVYFFSVSDNDGLVLETELLKLDLLK